ncbi:hypothetical protein M378DRAFT_18013 [Amanita muscaria Koide BX008]|uniref:Uncharacterized protein n=1 Tax=Amanita muscaria (strain Koide BX008) TaxID=946122 RepID=A0A0C2RYD7_AMAMK|nr:hypothetical protein M378DRAFT_18013 [Amanita muscaria Koide BX008]
MQANIFIGASLRVSQSRMTGKEEIEHMTTKAEKFATADEAQHKCSFKALNVLSSFVYSLKTQVNNQDGLSGKISKDNKTMMKRQSLTRTLSKINLYGAEMKI